MSITLFRYEKPRTDTNTLELRNAEIVADYDSLMWIERYTKSGEVRIKGSLRSGLRDLLPVGSILSHTDTNELMLVETVEIQDSYKKESTIEINGRTLDAIMQDRVISWPGLISNSPADNVALKTFPLAAGFTHDQIVTLITHHYSGAHKWSIPNLRAVADVEARDTPSSMAREVDVNHLLAGVEELLKIDNLGVKTFRPGSLISTGEDDFGFIVHNGLDLSDKVGLTRNLNDLESALYLWSIKNAKTDGMGVGDAYRVKKTSDVNALGFYARQGLFKVDDGDTPAIEQEPYLLSRADAYLSDQKASEISSAKSTKRLERFKYRIDYNIGDIVSVTGNYETSSKMRVVEHVEIEDSNGTSSYPTLEVVV